MIIINKGTNIKITIIVTLPTILLKQKILLII